MDHHGYYASIKQHNFLLGPYSANYTNYDSALHDYQTPTETATVVTSQNPQQQQQQQQQQQLLQQNHHQHNALSSSISSIDTSVPASSASVSSSAPSVVATTLSITGTALHHNLNSNALHDDNGGAVANSKVSNATQKLTDDMSTYTNPLDILYLTSTLTSMDSSTNNLTGHTVLDYGGIYSASKIFDTSAPTNASNTNAPSNTSQIAGAYPSNMNYADVDYNIYSKNSYYLPTTANVPSRNMHGSAGAPTAASGTEANTTNSGCQNKSVPTTMDNVHQSNRAINTYENRSSLKTTAPVAGSSASKLSNNSYVNYHHQSASSFKEPDSAAIGAYSKLSTSQTYPNYSPAVYSVRPQGTYDDGTSNNRSITGQNSSLYFCSSNPKSSDMYAADTTRYASNRNYYMNNTVAASHYLPSTPYLGSYNHAMNVRTQNVHPTRAILSTGYASQMDETNSYYNNMLHRPTPSEASYARTQVPTFQNPYSAYNRQGHPSITKMPSQKHDTNDLILANNNASFSEETYDRHLYHRTGTSLYNAEATEQYGDYQYPLPAYNASQYPTKTSTKVLYNAYNATGVPGVAGYQNSQSVQTPVVQPIAAHPIVPHHSVPFCQQSQQYTMHGHHQQQQSHVVPTTLISNDYTRYSAKSNAHSVYSNTNKDYTHGHYDSGCIQAAYPSITQSTLAPTKIIQTLSDTTVHAPTLATNKQSYPRRDADKYNFVDLEDQITGSKILKTSREPTSYAPQLMADSTNSIGSHHTDKASKRHYNAPIQHNTVIVSGYNKPCSELLYENDHYVYNYDAYNHAYQPQMVGYSQLQQRETAADSLKKQSLRDFLSSWNDDEDEEAAVAAAVAAAASITATSTTGTDTQHRKGKAYMGATSSTADSADSAHKKTGLFRPAPSQSIVAVPYVCNPVPLHPQSLGNRQSAAATTSAGAEVAQKIHINIAGDGTHNLPDIVIDIEKPKLIDEGETAVVSTTNPTPTTTASAHSALSASSASSSSEKLYVLESIDVPLSDLNKYKHLSVVDALPDNIVHASEHNSDTSTSGSRSSSDEVFESLKFIEEAESRNSKYFKPDFEIGMEYDEDGRMLFDAKGIVECRNPTVGKNVKQLMREYRKQREISRQSSFASADDLLKTNGKDAIMYTSSPLSTPPNTCALELPADSIFAVHDEDRSPVDLSIKLIPSPMSSSSSQQLPHSTTAHSVIERFEMCSLDPIETIDITSDNDEQDVDSVRSYQKSEQIIVIGQTMQQSALTHGNAVSRVDSLQKLCVRMMNTEEFRMFFRNTNLNGKRHEAIKCMQKTAGFVQNIPEMTAGATIADVGIEKVVPAAASIEYDGAQKDMPAMIVSHYAPVGTADTEVIDAEPLPHTFTPLSPLRELNDSPVPPKEIPLEPIAFVTPSTYRPPRFLYMGKTLSDLARDAVRKNQYHFNQNFRAMLDNGITLPDCTATSSNNDERNSLINMNPLDDRVRYHVRSLKDLAREVANTIYSFNVKPLKELCTLVIDRYNRLFIANQRELETFEMATAPYGPILNTDSENSQLAIDISSVATSPTIDNHQTNTELEQETVKLDKFAAPLCNIPDMKILSENIAHAYDLYRKVKTLKELSNAICDSTTCDITPDDHVADDRLSVPVDEVQRPKGAYRIISNEKNVACKVSTAAPSQTNIRQEVCGMRKQIVSLSELKPADAAVSTSVKVNICRNDEYSSDSGSEDVTDSSDSDSKNKAVSTRTSVRKSLSESSDSESSSNSDSDSDIDDTVEISSDSDEETSNLKLGANGQGIKMKIKLTGAGIAIDKSPVPVNSSPKRREIAKHIDNSGNVESSRLMTCEKTSLVEMEKSRIVKRVDPTKRAHHSDEEDMLIIDARDIQPFDCGVKNETLINKLIGERAQDARLKSLSLPDVKNLWRQSTKLATAQSALKPRVSMQFNPSSLLQHTKGIMPRPIPPCATAKMAIRRHSVDSRLFFQQKLARTQLIPPAPIKPIEPTKPVEKLSEKKKSFGKKKPPEKKPPVEKRKVANKKANAEKSSATNKKNNAEKKCNIDKKPTVEKKSPVERKSSVGKTSFTAKKPAAEKRRTEPANKSDDFTQLPISKRRKTIDSTFDRRHLVDSDDEDDSEAKKAIENTERNRKITKPDKIVPPLKFAELKRRAERRNSMMQTRSETRLEMQLRSGSVYDPSKTLEKPMTSTNRSSKTDVKTKHVIFANNVKRTANSRRKAHKDLSLADEKANEIAKILKVSQPFVVLEKCVVPTKSFTSAESEPATKRTLVGEQTPATDQKPPMKAPLLTKPGPKSKTFPAAHTMETRPETKIDCKPIVSTASTKVATEQTVSKANKNGIDNVQLGGDQIFGVAQNVEATQVDDTSSYCNVTSESNNEIPCDRSQLIANVPDDVLAQFQTTVALPSLATLCEHVLVTAANDQFSAPQYSMMCIVDNETNENHIWPVNSGHEEHSIILCYDTENNETNIFEVTNDAATSLSNGLVVNQHQQQETTGNTRTENADDQRSTLYAIANDVDIASFPLVPIDDSVLTTASAVNGAIGTRDDPQADNGLASTVTATDDSPSNEIYYFYPIDEVALTGAGADAIQYEEVVPSAESDENVMIKVVSFKNYLQSKYVQTSNYFKMLIINKLLRKYIIYQRIFMRRKPRLSMHKRRMLKRIKRKQLRAAKREARIIARKIEQKFKHNPKSSPSTSVHAAGSKSSEKPSKVRTKPDQVLPTPKRIENRRHTTIVNKQSSNYWEPIMHHTKTYANISKAAPRHRSYSTEKKPIDNHDSGVAVEKYRTQRNVNSNTGVHKRDEHWTMPAVRSTRNKNIYNGDPRLSGRLNTNRTIELVQPIVNTRTHRSMSIQVNDKNSSHSNAISKVQSIQMNRYSNNTNSGERVRALSYMRIPRAHKYNYQSHHINKNKNKNNNSCSGSSSSNKHSHHYRPLENVIPSSRAANRRAMIQTTPQMIGQGTESHRDMLPLEIKRTQSMQRCPKQLMLDRDKKLATVCDRSTLKNIVVNIRSKKDSLKRKCPIDSADDYEDNYRYDEDEDISRMLSSYVNCKIGQTKNGSGPGSDGAREPDAASKFDVSDNNNTIKSATAQSQTYRNALNNNNSSTTTHVIYSPTPSGSKDHLIDVEFVEDDAEILALYNRIDSRQRRIISDIAKKIKRKKLRFEDIVININKFYEKPSSPGKNRTRSDSSSSSSSSGSSSSSSSTSSSATSSSSGSSSTSSSNGDSSSSDCSSVLRKLKSNALLCRVFLEHHLLQGNTIYDVRALPHDDCPAPIRNTPNTIPFVKLHRNRFIDRLALRYHRKSQYQRRDFDS